MQTPERCSAAPALLAGARGCIALHPPGTAGQPSRPQPRADPSAAAALLVLRENGERDATKLRSMRQEAACRQHGSATRRTEEAGRRWLARREAQPTQAVPQPSDRPHQPEWPRRQAPRVHEVSEKASRHELAAQDGPPPPGRRAGAECDRDPLIAYSRFAWRSAIASALTPSRSRSTIATASSTIRALCSKSDPPY